LCCENVNHQFSVFEKFFCDSSAGAITLNGICQRCSLLNNICIMNFAVEHGSWTRVAGATKCFVTLVTQLSVTRKIGS